MDLAQIISQNIRQIRKEAKLSQREFAETLDVKQPNIHRWESRTNPIIPSVEALVKIAIRFKKPTDEIILSAMQRKRAHSNNLALSKRIKLIEKLGTEDQKTVLDLLDAFLKSKK